jgi:hypothetical protein
MNTYVVHRKTLLSMWFKASSVLITPFARSSSVGYAREYLIFLVSFTSFLRYTQRKTIVVATAVIMDAT